MHPRALALIPLLAAVALAAPRPSSADLLVSDIQRDVVRRFKDPGGSFAGDFVKYQSGGLRGPQGMAFGPDGNLYVASSGADAVMRYDGLTGESMGAFVHGGPGCSALAFGPDGNIYTACHATNEVRCYDGKTGRFLGVAVPAGGAHPLEGPTGITFGPGGNLFVASFRNSAVYAYDGRTGRFLGHMVPPGGGGLKKPIGIAFGPDGNLFVASSDGGGVLRYNGQTGQFMDEFVAPGQEGLAAPQGVIFGPDGNLYVSNFGTKGVLKFNGRTGVYMENFTNGGGGLYSPHLMAFTPVCGRLKMEERVLFQRTLPGSLRPVEITLENTSAAEELRLLLQGVEGPFDIVGGPRRITIQPGEKTTVTVLFKPTANGRATGKLLFRSSGHASGAVSVDLFGEGG